MAWQIHHQLTSSLRRVVGRSEAAAHPLEDSDVIVIRFSRDDDWPALERLAALDSKTLPAASSFLLAEIDGELAAAMPLDREGDLISDPFRPTANLRELLELRASRSCFGRGTPTPLRARSLLVLSRGGSSARLPLNHEHA